jgi:hypothetical protein
LKILFRYKTNHHNNKSMIDENDINDENKPVEDASQMVKIFIDLI